LPEGRENDGCHDEADQGHDQFWVLSV